ncbi:mandelate racemase/muconate lactonizing enzyme family protein [Pseudogracilibacillus sp. SO10305]|uniref:mandelate racemase/muconate lactonizing enzyme family protein n=1 Tax=Pseudogracilibacillus sp. SO10305 TaxID=3098292 RepID=UPI00300E1BD6
MKITDVKVYVLKNKLERPFAASQGWIKQRSATIVEVTTDEGVTGWGEALCQGFQHPEISAATIVYALKDLIVGENPMETEFLWHKMYTYTRDYGRKGAIIGAISAIDIALWDIKGKVFNQPVHCLLGGAFRDKVEAYATGFFRIEGKGEASRLKEEALSHLENGFRLMKVKLGFGVQDDVEVMESIFDTVGHEAEIMIDVNHAYGVADVVRLGKQLEHHPIRWLEEPVIPEDFDGYREVRNKLSIPIAGGENEYTGYGFKNLCEKNAVDIAQPDICISGGFTSGQHINSLAMFYGIEVNPHVWGTAVGQYASMHYIASIPISNYSLFATEPIFEYDTSTHPFRTTLVHNPIIHDEGWIDVPHTAGIGVDINREYLNEYAILYGE